MLQNNKVGNLGEMSLPKPTYKIMSNRLIYSQY